MTYGHEELQRACNGKTKSGGGLNVSDIRKYLNVTEGTRDDVQTQLCLALKNESTNKTKMKTKKVYDDVESGTRVRANIVVLDYDDPTRKVNYDKLRTHISNMFDIEVVDDVYVPKRHPEDTANTIDNVIRLDT